MTVWLLTVALGFPPEGSGLPFVTEHKCKEAAAQAAFTVPGETYFCIEVQRKAEHNQFFVDLAVSKDRLAKARAARKKEQAAKAAWGIQ